MGYIKRWDTRSMAHDLKRCAAEMNFSGNDGYIQWDCKKELLELKYLLDELIATGPTFGSLEEGLINELEQQKIYNILKHEEKN